MFRPGGIVGEDARHGAGAGDGAVHRVRVVGQLGAGEVVGEVGRGDVVAGGDEVAGVDVVAPVGAGGDLRGLRRRGQPRRAEVGTDADVVLELAALHVDRHAVERRQGTGGRLRVGDLAVARRPLVEPLKRDRTESRKYVGLGPDVVTHSSGMSSPRLRSRRRSSMGSLTSTSRVPGPLPSKTLMVIVGTDERHDEGQRDRSGAEAEGGVADRPGAHGERALLAVGGAAPAGDVVAVLQEDEGQEEARDDREQPPRDGLAGHRDRQGVRRQQHEAGHGCAAQRAGDDVDEHDHERAADEQQRVDGRYAGLHRCGVVA